MLASPPRILITDDDSGFRETLRDVFEPEGVETVLAEDGEKALDIARREQVHVLLSDMHMPKLTGLETIRRIQQIAGPIPCILLSAKADRAILEEALRLRAFSVLAKPVSRRRITSIVNLALREFYDWPRLLRRL